MIHVKQIEKSYGARRVLANVSAQFPKGKVTSLIGPNGAGKTTLLMLIARLQEPGQGEILLGGRSIADIRIADYARQVATLRQSPDFNLRLTVEELVAFGRFGLLGRHFGLWQHVSFNWLAVTFALMLVAGPFYVRSAIAAFEAVDETLLDASRTLGAGPARTFFRIALPLAAGGLAAGEALSLARGIGEFGATITFVSNIPGETQTISALIYTLTQVPGGDAAAGRLVLIAIALAFVALFASEWLARRASVRFHGE